MKVVHFVVLYKNHIFYNPVKTPVVDFTKSCKSKISRKCDFQPINSLEIRVITKLSNSEQSYKGKVKAHNYTNRQNQSHLRLILDLRLFVKSTPDSLWFATMYIHIDDILLSADMSKVLLNSF